MINLTPDQRRILEHTLNAGTGRTAYRNYYASGAGDGDLLQPLVDAGLMIRGREYSQGNVLYHATAAGAAAVGLTLPLEEQPEWSAPPPR